MTRRRAVAEDVRTVSTHLRCAFSKLEIKSRIELTRLIARHEHSAV
jgi:DNA-binding NarL/FixJ family response regulator